MAVYTLLGISGSLRKEAVNSKLLREGARLFQPAAFEEADLRLPLYDNDLETEQGIPQAVEKLAAQIRNADAVFMTTPEYNQALSGVLKNALDWISRVKGSPLKGKPLAIATATSGRAGGARAQYSLRLCLVPFRPRLVAGPEVLVADSGNAFSDEGTLLSERYTDRLRELMAELKEEIRRGP